jgi:hypothetical protein
MFEGFKQHTDKHDNFADPDEVFVAQCRLEQLVQAETGRSA